MSKKHNSKKPDAAKTHAGRSMIKKKSKKGSVRGALPVKPSSVDTRIERDAEVDRAEERAAEKAAAASEKSNAKAAKRAAKGKSSVPAPVTEVESEQAAAKKAKRQRKRIEELAAIIDDPGTKKGARKAARAELEALLPVEQQSDSGEGRVDAQAQIDAEVAARVAQRRSEAEGKPAPLADLKAARNADALPGEGEVDYQQRKLKAKTSGKRTPPVASDDTPIALQVAEASEAGIAIVASGGSEDGVQSDAVRDVVDAAPVVEEFGMPSEAKLFEDNVNGLGQYKVKRPGDGKEVGYTRATTYIATNEDTTMLTQWKMRVLLEGAAADMVASSQDGSRGVPALVQVNDLVHRRDVAIAKARKADRKGKLVPGQLATIVDGAWSDFKKEMNALADAVFDLGGGHEKAQKGTDIHALCDLADAEGIAAVEQKLQDGEITPADLADVEAYLAACRALGLKVVASELVVVNDEKKVGGRLDRIFLAKIPEIRDTKGEVIFKGDTRARRYVGDMKTGRVDLSAGKIAQQIRLYAESEAYDEETGERTSHGANRTHGLLIHVPAGTATAHVHLVDLGVGAVGNKLSGEVRQFRNAGKRAYDTKIDLVQVATAASESDAASADVAAQE